MKSFENKFALLIGAQDYKGLSKLDFPADDVADFRDALVDHLSFPSENITCLTDRSDSKPEFSNIYQQLAELKERKVGPDDLLFFFFSGHGMTDEKGHTDFLLPSSTAQAALEETAIPVTKVIKYLKDTKCKNVVMFIDACRNPIRGVHAKGKGIPGGLGAASKSVLERTGIVTFFSCDPSERSYEIESLQNGSFTYCLVEAIASRSAVTVTEMNDFLKLKIPETNRENNVPEQLPYLVLEPQDKANLPIFLAGEPPVDTEIERYAKILTELLEDWIGEKEPVFEAFGILTKKNRSPKEEALFRLIKNLCNGDSTPQTFAHAWRGVRKATLGTPQIREPRKFND